MVMSKQDDIRTKWGRTHIAGLNLGAMNVAIPVGVLLAVIAGVVAGRVGLDGERAWLGGIVFGFMVSWGLVALVWIIIVDRKTLLGATDRPEESIESSWMQTASSGAFFDTVAIAGFGSAIVSFMDVDWSGSLLLLGIAVIGMSSFGIRYLISSRRG